MSFRVAGKFATRDEYVIDVVSRMLEDCAGYRDGDELAAQRKKALDYYFMRDRGDELPGRSRVQSGDLSAMVDACMAQMMTAYKGRNICEFEPDGADDEDQAALESDAVTQVIFNKGNRGYITMQEGVKNALLLANGIGKVWCDDEPRARERVFRNVSAEAYAELTRERRGVKLERIDWQNGTLRYSERRERKRCRVASVDPANFIFTRNWDSTNLDNIPCVGERHVSTRSELLSVWKFPKRAVEEAHPYTGTSGAETARNVKGSTRPPNRSAQPALDLIEWYQVWVLLDIDGTGIAERRQVCLIPQKALFKNEADDVPYGVGFTLVNPGRLVGVSLYHKLKQNQDSNTALLRAAHDNAYANNRQRVVYLKGAVDPADLEDPRVSANIGASGVADARQAAAALAVQDTTAGLLAMLQEGKRTRTELGGASLELASGQAQLTDKVGSQGVDRMYSVMEQLAELMTLTFAETFVRDVYLLVHKVLRENFREPITLRRRGKLVTTIPAEWPERESVNVKLGMTAGERTRKLTALQTNLQAQLMLAREGMTGIIVDPAKFYALLMDYNRMAELPNPEQWYIDPDSDQAKETAAKRDQAAAQERIAQQRLTAKALGFEQLRIALEKYGGDADRAVKVFEAILDAQAKEAGVVGDAATKFELAERETERLEKQAELDAEAAERDAELVKGIERAAGSVKTMHNGGMSAEH